MLVIRRQQMEAFRAARRRDFVRSLAARARSESPEATLLLNDAALCDRIERALTKAPAHGFVVLAHQTRFAVLALRAGEEALSAPAARDILDDDTLPGTIRLDRLEELLAR